MSAPLDLATYRRLTRITFSDAFFEPHFALGASECTDLSELAKSLGLKAHFQIFEPSEACFTDSDPIEGNPFTSTIASQAQEFFQSKYPEADLVGCWQLEDGDWQVMWVEPLDETGGAA